MEEADRESLRGPTEIARRFNARGKLPNSYQKSDGLMD